MTQIYILLQQNAAWRLSQTPLAITLFFTQSSPLSLSSEAILALLHHCFVLPNQYEVLRAQTTFFNFSHFVFCGSLVKSWSLYPFIKTHSKAERWKMTGFIQTQRKRIIKFKQEKLTASLAELIKKTNVASSLSAALYEPTKNGLYNFPTVHDMEILKEWFLGGSHIIITHRAFCMLSPLCVSSRSFFLYSQSDAGAQNDLCKCMFILYGPRGSSMISWDVRASFKGLLHDGGIRFKLFLQAI